MKRGAGQKSERLDTQRYPVRSDEYLAYLNELSREDADASMARVPREGATGHPLWFWAGDGTWVVPTAEWLGKAPAGVRAAIARLPASHGEWEDAWPVLGLSWEDALHYAAWRRKGEGYAFTLPSDREWEGAARGADGRAFPWGDSREWTYANSCVSSEGGAGPASVDRFPTDESPFGVRGMAGNAADPCLNDPGGKGAGLRTFRGGTWRSAGSYDVLGVHHGGPPDAVGETQTIRLAVWPRLRDRGPDTG